MTKASFNPKVDIVRPADAGDDEILTTTPNANSKAPKVDSYVPGVNDPYKTLTSGKPKAQEYLTSQLVSGAVSYASRMKQDPWQRLIGQLMMGDETSGTPTKGDFEKIVVPDHRQLYKVLSGVPTWTLYNRYQTLEKQIIKLIQAADSSLSPQNSGNMTPAEIAALRGHREDLEKSLYSCRSELASVKQLCDIEETELSEELKNKTT